MFLVFINDISSVFSDVFFLLFADDLKLFKPIKSLSDQLTLQHNLDLLTNWCSTNHLNLNTSKCYYINYSRNKNITPSHFYYNISGQTLTQVDVIKDLGIYFDSSLTFKTHIQTITSKSLRTLGFVIRHSNSFHNVNVLKLLYTSLVRPQLEFASIIWSPYYSYLINDIERVQHRFLRYVNWFNTHSFSVSVNYSNILSSLNLETLESRRKKTDLIFLFKLLNNVIDCPEILNSIQFNIPSYNLRKFLVFNVPISTTNYNYFSPLNRILRLGNKVEFDFFSDKFSTLKGIEL